MVMLIKRHKRYVPHISPLVARADANERPRITFLKVAMTANEIAEVRSKLVAYICHSPWMKANWWHKRPAVPAASSSGMGFMLCWGNRAPWTSADVTEFPCPLEGQRSIS